MVKSNKEALKVHRWISVRRFNSYKVTVIFPAAVFNSGKEMIKAGNCKKNADGEGPSAFI